MKRSVILAIALAVASPALADSVPEKDFPIDLVGFVVDGAKTVEALTLLGRSGQVYEPGADGWHRTQPGGVATDVAGGVKVGKVLFAVGNRAPIYKRLDSVWLSTPLPNRGSAALGIGGYGPLAALGPHIYQLQSGDWQRLTTAERSITALWAHSKSQIFVATSRGRLRLTDGRKWSAIPNSMATEDEIVHMRGSKNGDVYGLAASGSLLWIQRTQATNVALDGDLVDFAIHTLGLGREGEVVISGVDSAGKTRMVSLLKGHVKASEELWPLADGDRFSVVFTDSKGTLLVGTRLGRVQLSSQAGTWRERPIAGRLSTLAPVSPPGSAPARAR